MDFKRVSLAALLSLIIFYPPSALATEKIDEMIENLSKKLVDRNMSGFSGLAADYFVRDPRSPDGLRDKLEPNIQSSFSQIEQIGPILNASVIKKMMCGERMAQVFWVAFGEQGHVGLVYWLFNVTGRWSIANLKFEAQAGPGDFVNTLGPHLSATC